MLTETEWRQRELDKKIEKLKLGYYNSYYYEDNIIVFVKEDKINCCNVSGLVCDLI